METRVFQTVIVGVDFSRYSRLVVRQAERLAREFRCKLVLVHAAFEPMQINGPDGYPIPLVVPVNVELLQKSVRSFYRMRRKAQIVVQRGFPKQVIRKVADQMDRPLIVVGAGSRNPIARIFLGSHAEEIALSSDYPVWVHRGVKVVRPRRILVPVDLSLTAKKLTFIFKRWSQDLKLTFNYLFVRPEAPLAMGYPAYRMSYLRMMDGVRDALTKFQRDEPKMKLTTVTGDPAKRICDRGRSFDLIALTPQKKKGVVASFSRVTSKVIRRSEVPILVVKPAA